MLNRKQMVLPLSKATGITGVITPREITLSD
jgi:hypothetical protein